MKSAARASGPPHTRNTGTDLQPACDTPVPWGCHHCTRSGRGHTRGASPARHCSPRHLFSSTSPSHAGDDTETAPAVWVLSWLNWNPGINAVFVQLSEEKQLGEAREIFCCCAQHGRKINLDLSSQYQPGVTYKDRASIINKHHYKNHF